MLRAQSGIGFSGGGIGLKAQGILVQSNSVATLTGTTTNTMVATDTIPAGRLQVGALLDFMAFMTRSGTGTSSLRCYVTDGTNTLQFIGATAPTGTMLMQAGNSVPLLATKSQIAGTVVSPYSSGAAYGASVLDETKAWTVQYWIQQTVAGDTSNLVFRRVMLSNQ